MYIKTSSIVALLTYVSIHTIITQALPVTNTITDTNTNINNNNSLIQHRSERADKPACTAKGRNPFTSAGFTECCDGLEKELGLDASTGSFHYICVVHENIDDAVEKEATLFLKGSIGRQNKDKDTEENNTKENNNKSENSNKNAASGAPILVSVDESQEELYDYDDDDDEYDDEYDEEEEEDDDYDEEDYYNDDDELGPEPGDDY